MFGKKKSSDYRVKPCYHCRFVLCKDGEAVLECGEFKTVAYIAVDHLPSAGTQLVIADFSDSDFCTSAVEYKVIAIKQIVEAKSLNQKSFGEVCDFKVSKSFYEVYVEAF